MLRRGTRYSIDWDARPGNMVASSLWAADQKGLDSGDAQKSGRLDWRASRPNSIEKMSEITASLPVAVGQVGDSKNKKRKAARNVISTPDTLRNASLCRRAYEAIRPGFYIDIGRNHRASDSVTAVH